MRNRCIKFYLPALVFTLVVASAGHADQTHEQHRSFDIQADEYTHGMEIGNVKTGDNVIELYGRLFLSGTYNYVPDEETGFGVASEDHGERYAYLSSSGSRFGIRGHKNISLTTRLFWQIESSVDLSSLGEYDEETHYGNTSDFAGRDSFIGLVSNVGTFLFGKHNSPYKMAVHAWDPFNHVNGDFRSILGRVNGFSTRYDHHENIYHTRLPNTLLYYSPEFMGVSANIAIGELIERAESQVPIISANLKYHIGIVDLVYAFEQHWNVESYRADHDAVPVAIDSSNAHLVGAMVHLGNTMVSLIGERIMFSNAGMFDGWVRYAWHSSVTHNIGAHSVRLGYTQSGQFKAEPDSGLMVTGGWFYHFSDKSTLHVTATYLKNQAESNYGNFMSEEFEHDEDITTVSVGVIHEF